MLRACSSACIQMWNFMTLASIFVAERFARVAREAQDSHSLELSCQRGDFALRPRVQLRD